MWPVVGMGHHGLCTTICGLGLLVGLYYKVWVVCSEANNDDDVLATSSMVAFFCYSARQVTSWSMLGIVCGLNCVGFSPILS